MHLRWLTLLAIFYIAPALSAPIIFNALVPKSENKLLIQIETQKMIPITIKNISGPPLRRLIYITASDGVTCSHTDPTTGENIYVHFQNTPQNNVEQFQISSGQSIQCQIDTLHYPPSTVYIKLSGSIIALPGLPKPYDGNSVIQITVDESDKPLIQLKETPIH